MASQLDLQALKPLTLTGVAHHCEQETERFFQRQRHDPRYCFELFRRAILECGQRAWQLVYAQYRPLVAGWVERHTALEATGEEPQYFVNRASEKIYGSFVLALKPRELCVHRQEILPDVTEVYQVKQNVLARLRREAELEKILSQDA